MAKKNIRKSHKKNSMLRAEKKTAKAVTQLVKIQKAISPYSVINNSRPQIYKFQRTLLGQTTALIPTTTAFNVTTGVLFAQPSSGLNGNFSTCVAFQANEVPNWSDFSSLFQQYRISKIEFVPRMTNGVANSVVEPIIYIWKNYYPSLLGSDITLATADQVSKVIRYQYSAQNRECKFAIVPYYLDAVPTGNTGTLAPVAAARKRGWLDTSYGNVNHYGIAYSFDNLVGSDTDVLSFEFDMTFHYEFRGLR